MNQEIKQRWIAWLRDPANKQGKGQLRSGRNRYCCLGGLCELAVEAGVTTRTQVAGPRSAYLYGSNASYLPAEVVRWAGLEAPSPTITLIPNGGRHELAALNDQPVPFDEIANLIEECL